MSLPYRPIAANFNDLTINSSRYAGQSPAQARESIKKILDQMTFGASIEPISYARAAGSDGVVGAAVASRVVISGVTWMYGNVDGTTNTGPIVFGKPVVVDTTTGYTVTGIHPSWGSNEYKVIGLAMGSLPFGQARVPVLLGVTSPTDNFAVVSKCRFQTTHPTMQDWSAADQGYANQQTVWQFELPASHNFNDGQPTAWFANANTGSNSRWYGSGAFVTAFNLDRTYVYKNSFCLLHSTGKGGPLQFYFNFQMAQSICGTLAADLKKDQSANINIDSLFQGGIQGTTCKVYDKLLSTGKKLPSGAKVWANLIRYGGTGGEAGSDPFVWRWYVTQADKCPATDTGGGTG